MEARWPQSTIWSEVDRARRGESQALTGLVNRYRPAVVSYFRGRGLNPDDAEDLAQDLFLYLIRGEVLAKADPGKGRFRSLLLAVAKHVVSNEFRARNRIKRGGGRTLISLDVATLPPVSAPEEEEFDRTWIRQLMTAALADLEIAHPRHYRAIRSSLDGLSQAGIAEALAISVAAANNHVHRAKTFIRKRLRELVAESCLGEEDVKQELGHLSRYLE